MKQTTLQLLQTAAGTGVARALSAALAGMVAGAGAYVGRLRATFGICGNAWFAIDRKPMLVPTSTHDRWPLCSTT